MSEAASRFRPYCAIQVALVRDEEVLLSRRLATGFEDGKYGLIAGHIQGGEPARQAAVREAREEAGVRIDTSALEHMYTLHRLSPDREYIDIFFECRSWSGTPEIREPDRCDELAWFPFNALPAETIDYIRLAFDEWRGGSTFGEIGWPQTAEGGSGTTQ